MTSSGLYQIVNQTTRKRYIGVSKDIDARWQVHRSQLRQNDHHSIYLQRSWNIHGEECFSFEIIRECPRKCASCLEMILISLLGTELYNISQVEIEDFHSERRQFSDDHRAKLSQSRKEYLRLHPETIPHFTRNLEFARTPEARQRGVETFHRRMQDPKFRDAVLQKKREARKLSSYDPSQAQKDRWADPEFAARVSAAIVEAKKNAEPHSAERKLSTFAKQSFSRQKSGKRPFTSGLILHPKMIEAHRILSAGQTLDTFDWGEELLKLYTGDTE